MYFGITEKPTMDCVYMGSNAGLISKVTEGIASEIAENCRFDNPTVVLPENPRKYPHKSYIARN